MTNSLLSDQDYYLWMLLIYVRRGILKLREKELYQYGITPEQAGILFCIQVSTKPEFPISNWGHRQALMVK